MSKELSSGGGYVKNNLIHHYRAEPKNEICRTSGSSYGKMMVSVDPDFESLIRPNRGRVKGRVVSGSPIFRAVSLVVGAMVSHTIGHWFKSSIT